MQDFTKSITANNELTTITKQPKWLNKDRFWTFVFWFGMSLGLTIGIFIKINLKMPQSTAFIACATLIGVPLLLIIFNRTKFVKKDTFANSEGKILLPEQMPYGFPFAIAAGFGFAFLLSETILPKQLNTIIVTFIFFSSLFSGVSLYCIFKNCPISLLFNRKFWTIEWHHQGGSNNSYYSSARNNAIFSDRPESVYGRHRKP